MTKSWTLFKEIHVQYGNKNCMKKQNKHGSMRRNKASSVTIEKKVKKEGKQEKEDGI